MKLIICTFHTPAGWHEMAHDEQHIHRAIFSDLQKPQALTTKLSHTISHELDSYFSNPYHRLQLPLKPQGTA